MTICTFNYADLLAISVNTLVMTDNIHVRIEIDRCIAFLRLTILCSVCRFAIVSRINLNLYKLILPSSSSFRVSLCTPSFVLLFCAVLFVYAFRRSSVHKFSFFHISV